MGDGAASIQQTCRRQNEGTGADRDPPCRFFSQILDPLQGCRILAKRKGAFAAAAYQRVETKPRLIKGVVRIQGHAG